MDYFEYQDGTLHCEEVSLSEIAESVGTPCYVYSYATLRRHYQVFDAALADSPHLICYSVKSNTSAAVLTSLASLGAGADVVSGGELYRALRSGIAADRIVFSGVGKQATEIEQALHAGILLFNVESEAELSLIEQVASRLGKCAPIALRVNPDVDPQTHPYIATGLRKSKFGIPLDQAWPLYQRVVASAHLKVLGIDCHIGSQLTQLGPLKVAVRSVLELARRLKQRFGEGVDLRFVDVGGGLGIPYDAEEPPPPKDYGQAMSELLTEFDDLALTLICEPGRVIMGNAGILLSRVLLLKDNGDKRFVIVDGAMNDLLRPSLYDSFHRIVAVRPREGAAIVADIVGPVCESGDFFARDRQLSRCQAGDLLALRSAGAYGFCMASNYNSRPRPAEVFVRGDRYQIIRRRETYQDLVRGESVPDWVRKP